MKALFVSTVAEFYRQRTGTFFVILGVLFGFLSSNEHRAFALFFLTADFGMLYLSGIWLIYSLLCCHHVLTLWKQPEYTFVYQLRLFTFPARVKMLFLMAVGLLQPLVFYGVYLSLIGITAHATAHLWLVAIILVLLSILLVLVMEWRLRNPELYVKSSADSLIKWPFPRPALWTWWTLEFFFRVKGLTVLVCKLGALAVFAGTISYYSSDAYDIRLLGVGLGLGYLLNIGLSFEIYRWDKEIWLWNRSLPVSVEERFGSILLVHVVLLLPETLMLFNADTILMVESFQLFLMGLSLLLLFYAFLTKNGGDLDAYGKYLLGGYVILTLLILYRVPVVLLGVVALLFARTYFRKWYFAS